MKQSFFKTIALASIALLAVANAQAQTENLSVSGYIQTQLEAGQKDAKTKLGNTTSTQDWDNKGSFTRAGIRRGRIKFSYAADTYAKGVFQLDVTEVGVKFKDAYLNLTVPSVNWISVKAGIFDRPFGDEISYSSSRREIAERSIGTQTLFPDERDLGATLILTAPKGSAIEGLGFEGGFFAGNGITKEDDGKYDFIGHLRFQKKYDNSSFGIGTSLYSGKVYNLNNAGGIYTTYEIQNGAWVASTGSEKFNNRTYYGFDAQYSCQTPLGLTRLRGEYVFGEQPSQSGNMSSPKAGALSTEKGYDYIRNFAAAHIYLVQDLFSTPFAVAFRYSVFDQNTDLNKDEVKSSADVKQNGYSVSGIWRMTPAVSLMACYDITTNEKCPNLAGYESDRKDNLFTMRLQYKF
ncbi:MAG: hypothetical protein PHV66_03145 [Bacteroidales bacterium]|nr:hypothetical protein [Bacteroidales bacterium]